MGPVRAEGGWEGKPGGVVGGGGREGVKPWGDVRVAGGRVE